MTEQDLFYYLKKRYLQDLTQSVHKYEYYDCYSDYGKLQVELKCRSKHYEILLIEQDKYEALIATAADNDYAPWYINSTPAGVYAFDLSKLQLNWVQRDLPATTEFASVRLVSKQVAFIPVKGALNL